MPWSRSTPPLCQGLGAESAVSRHLASVAEASKQRFQPEERGELRAQAFELEKQSGGVVAFLGIHTDERVAGAFNNSQLRRHQRDPIELPADFLLQHRRQITAVAGSQRLELFETITPKRIVVLDALAAEQAPESIGMLMRSLSSVPRSRVRRRRSSSSRLGARTMEQTRRSPRAQAISVRNSVSPSIASVLARRCLRLTAIEAASTTWLSIPLASSNR